jgi:hypothetical protein
MRKLKDSYILSIMAAPKPGAFAQLCIARPCSLLSGALLVGSEPSVRPNHPICLTPFLSWVSPSSTNGDYPFVA